MSLERRPKQFLRLFGPETLFEATLRRVGKIEGVRDPIVMTGEQQALLAASAIEGMEEITLLVEPAPRNTAPAILAAALSANPDDVLLVVPSDHLIKDEDSFAQVAATASHLAVDGNIVTYGCVADRPETGFGWIEPGEAVGEGFRIKRFVEKPTPEVAAELLASGLLWNSGMFMGRADVIVREMRQLEPALSSSVADAFRERADGLLGQAFLDVPSISFDRAVMENTNSGVVVPLDVGWNDVGSWHAVWEQSAKDTSGNALSGSVVTVGVEESLVFAESRPVAVIGLDNVVVVESDDGILVAAKERAQEVRGVPELFKPQSDDL